MFVPKHKFFVLLGTFGVFVFSLSAIIYHQQAIADFVLAGRNGVTAALTGVTLNNGSGNVVSGNDVTSQVTALLPDTGAYTWTKDGANYMALNMPFNSGAAQTDFSGNGNNGTVSEAVFTTTGCEVGPCFTFDGVDDYVTLGTASALTVTSGSIALEAWIYPERSTNYIFGRSYNNANHGNYALSMNVGFLRFGYFGATPAPHFYTTNSTLSLNQWHHVVAVHTYGSGASTKLYVDGIEAPASWTSGTGNDTAAVGCDCQLWIGRWYGTPSATSDGYHFDGLIDDVKIYTRAISAAQVAQNYADGNTGVGGPTTIQSEETAVGQVWDLSITPITTSGTVGSALESSNPVVIVSGVPTITGTLDNPDDGSPIISALTIPGGSTAGYRWINNGTNYMAVNMPFNSGASLLDVSGYGNTGTTINDPTFTTSGCRVGNCLTFDGVNDRIEIADASSLDITSAITIETWLNLSVSAVKELIDKNNSTNTGPGAYQIYQNSQNISFRLVKGGVLSTMTSATSLSLSTWYHVAATWDGVTMRVYINGAQDSTTLALAAPIDASTGKLIIGAYTDNQFAYNGKMDEVRIYPYALSAAQIVQSYQDGLESVGGPARMSPQEHALNQTWDLIATEFLSNGSVGSAGYIDSATIVSAAATTLGITTPGATQTGNVTINYSCSNGTSSLRDLLVEYSTDGGGSFANATVASSSSGSVAGSVLSMVACNSGTSNNSFVWNSIANGVGDSSIVQIRITAQYPGGPSAVTTNFTSDNPTNLCTAGGEATGGLTAAETSFDGTAVAIYNCTFTIDGAHSFSSFTVGDGVGTGDSIVKHSATTTTTIFSLNITSTSDITVNSDGIVDANGMGYLGANRGANTGTAIGRTTGNTTTGGSTNNVGGSHGGLGGRPANSVAVTYDSITNPVEPGGGGGSRDSSNGGRTGGGVIHLTATGSILVSGTIRANGEQTGGSNGGGGAGGSVKLTAGGTLSGAGSITANGSNGIGNNGDATGGGGGGRIALYYGSSSFTGAMTSYGGLLANAGVNASAGTVYTKAAAQANGDLIVDNNDIVAIISGTTLPSTPTDYDNVTVRNRGRAMITQLQADATPWTIGTLSVESNGDITSAETNLTNVYKLNFSVTNLTIDSTGTITTDGRGYYTAGPGKTGTASGRTAGNAVGSGNYTGGSHGGLGGQIGSSTLAPTYDSITAPVDAGGGGGARDSFNFGHDGGGIIRIVATGTMTINGVLSADGEQTGGSNGGGGAGGAMHITVGTLAGSGSIRANGSNAIGNNGDNTGGGGGGRMAIHYTTNAFAGTISAYGGLLANAGVNANAGTVYLKSDAQTNGDLIIDNNNVVAVISGTTLPNTPNTYDNVTIRNRGRARITQLQADATPWTVGVFSLETNSDLSSAESDLSNVYKLYLSVTTLSVDATSSILTDGRGYLGAGTTTVRGQTTGNTLGSGNYTGGSHGGLGGQIGANILAPTYDSITDPVDAGGGGGSRDTVNTGRDGGGIIKIVVAGTLTVNGAISSNGDPSGGSNGGGGGGGTVNLTVGALVGSGSIRANGGLAIGVSGDATGGGGGGRVAVYYTTNSFLGTISTYGGLKANAGVDANAGTVYMKSAAQSNGDLIIDNNNALGVISGTTLPTTPIIFDNVTIRNRGRARITQLQADATPWTIGVLSLETNSDLSSAQTDLSNVYKLNLSVTTLTIDATSSVTSTDRGYLGARRNGNGATGRTLGNGTVGGSSDNTVGGGNGGSHGGLGGINGGTLGTPYGDLTNPSEPGAGAGGRSSGGHQAGNGGGIIHLLVAGTATINGSLSVDGGVPVAGHYGGGGAGGSIYLETGIFAGSGTLSALGGASAGGAASGSGGGGRIAVVYGTKTFSGSYSVYGGTPILTGQRGASGTVFLKQSADSYGSLRVDDNNFVTTATTKLFVNDVAATTYTFIDLSVLNQAQLVIDSPCSGTPALTVNGTTDLSGGGTITNNQSGTCTVTQGVISVTTTSLPTATLNSAYSQSIASTGGYGPHTFVCRSGGVTVACTTVLPTGLNMSSAGVVSGTPTVAGTTSFTVRATEASPGIGTDEETISITVSNAPTAPTSLFSNATDASTCCSSSTTDATPVFSAVFNDPDTGNTGAKYRIQVASDAGFTSLLWDSSSSGIAMASTAIGSRSPNINYAGSALTLGGVTYYWKIKFWDNDGLEGPFSATSTFTTSTAPTAPTTLYSNDGSAQTGLTNPVGVTSGRPNFSAIYNDPDIGDIANKYRIQVDDNNDFSSVVWDSGSAGTSMANCNEGSRCADIAFGAVAELDVDESVYFWRIKFFDQSGVESPWSQDPISTNKFTMGTGGSSQQRITDLQQQNQEQQEQESLPAAPQAVSVEVLGSTTLRYNWLDNSNNETGFRLLDANDVVIADVPAGATSAQEINLAPNTQVTGRKVVAYNAVGQSSPSEFSSAVTSVPQVRPRLLGRTQHSVTFSIEPAFSSFPGDTAIMYEILVTRPRLGISQLRLSSEWIQTNEYTFEGIEADDEIEVRVTTRNQVAISSTPTVYEEMEDLSRRFAVTLGVFKKGTNTLPRPLATNEIFSVSVQVQNIGSLAASNVLVSLPLPRYIVYRGGTLTVDGRGQSDGADQDAGQAGGNAVSAIWSQMAPNETHILRFELAFDEAALNLLRPQPVTETNQAQAAANPIINLQVAVSFAESEDVYMSPVVSLEPDVTEAEPIIVPPTEPEPIPEEPVPLPTPEEVQEINEFLNQIIQQEVQESGGDAGAKSPAASTPEPTTVSSDGPSFNVEVTNEAGDSLSLTGLATANDDQIEFTGTTSQPFTLVTLIFNNSVTAIVVSDANGNWRTFVSADQLGIKPGQEASVKIEAIASKGDLRSERVQVGEVRISLGRGGDIEAEFDTTVSSNNVVTAINEVRKEVVRVIEEQQPVIQTTLSVTAPVVVVSSVPLWGYLPYVPTMIYHFLTYLLGLIGRKKKGQQRFYGVVYDSITKQPLPLAIVRIYSSLVIPTEAEARLPAPEPIRSPSGEAAANGRSDGGQGSHPSQRKLVSTTVTDKLGRYEALLAPGKYTLEVTKPAYQFPSQIVTTEVDANFHIYKSQDGMTIGEQGAEITVPDVPLDPVNTQRQWQLTGGIKKVWLAIQKVGNYLAVPVLLVGSIASVATVAAIPDKGLNWILAIMYVLLLAAQLRLRPKLMKTWGVVYDIATNAVLPLTTIQLIDPQYGKVVTSRLSDYEGRFSFLPEPGSYVIKANKPGYSQVTEVVEAPQTNRQPVQGDITIDKPDQRISGDVAMKSVEA